MHANNNSKGIVLIIIAMTLFAMQDSLIKFIFEKAALYEIFFGRYFVAALLLFCFIKYKNEKVTLKTYYPVLTFVRVILHFLAFSAFFISLTYNPFIFSLSLMLGGFVIGILEVAVNLEADRIEYKISKKIMNRSHSFWSLGFFCSGLTGALFSQMKVSPFINFSLSLFLGTFLTILFCSKYIPADERPNSSVNNSLFVKPTKAVLALVVLTLSPMLLESASIDWSVIYMRDIFFTSPFINGLAIVMVALTQFSVRYYADQYVEIYGSEKVSKISVAAMLIGVVSVCFSNSPYLSLVGFVFIGGGSAVIFPLAMSAAAQKTDRPAEINIASLAQISFLVFLLAPPILGFIAENFGIRISFGIGLPLVIVSWFFISSLKSK